MWLVCEEKATGRLSVTTREKREVELTKHFLLEEAVPTKVLKTFQTKKDAVKYKADMKQANKLIKQIFIG